ncbi:E3 ubiquitin-protein ligase RNF4-like, partial [Cyanistes caeruleus]|uniref:E3 ubiquitin-protein ligase RNF4-like n=1 Tax=Cyanistes caeruleus TaxID=156563 RepID=UPI000CDA6969
FVLSQQKRPGEALHSGPAEKRSRLLTSRAGESLQTDPRDLEERGSPALEPVYGEVADSSEDSSEIDVVTVSDDESALQIQQQPHLFRAPENSAEPLPRNDGVAPREDDGARTAILIIPLIPEADNAELLQVHGQEWRNVAVNTQEQVDGSADGSGPNDAPVAVAAPAEQASEEDIEHSAAEPGVVISCPICMDFYSEIMQKGRQLYTTVCGHVFCSACLPVALETTGMCPTCRAELDPELYFPLYL